MMPTSIDISEEDGIRYLHFGSEWVQGAMRIRRPIDLHLEYTRHMMFGLLLRPPTWPTRILLIGLGAGSLTKFCYWRLPHADITTVEIDAGVWAAARHMFKLPDEDQRLHIEIANGIDFMQAPGPRYDYILIDGYDARARAGALESQSFYATCRTRLNENGILATNLFGRSRPSTKPLKLLETAFNNHVLSLPACQSGNVVAMAGVTNEEIPSHEELKILCQTLKKSTGLDLWNIAKQLNAPSI